MWMKYNNIKNIILKAFPVLVITCIMSVISGQILGYEEDILKKWPLLLVLTPSLLKIGGDTGCMMGSRLSSALHFGISKNIKNNPIVINNFISSLIIGFISILFSNIIIWCLSFYIKTKNQVPFSYILFCSFCVYFFDIIFVYIITIILSLFCHKYGLDPDDIVIPLVSSFGDLAGVIGIMVSIFIIITIP